jgi:hypothetical protein
MLASNGFAFSFVFAWVAGLAATATACKCVRNASLRGLAYTSGVGTSRGTAQRALSVFTCGVVAFGALYGLIIGFLGPDGAMTLTVRLVGSAVVQWFFTGTGLLILLWGAKELRYVPDPSRRLPPPAREGLAAKLTKAGLMGSLVGLFAEGHAFPPLRESLTYAAALSSPGHGAAVMAIHGLGQITVMGVLFLPLFHAPLRPLRRYLAERPRRLAEVGAAALISGGSYFVYYWGLVISAAIWSSGLRPG